MPKREKLKPAEWLSAGELDADRIEDEDDILRQAARLLDQSCATEILGPVVFRAGDGKHYCVTVEAVIGEADPEWVKDLQAEKAAEAQGPS